MGLREEEEEKEISQSGRVWRRGETPGLKTIQEREAWLPCEGAGRVRLRGRPTGSRAANREYRISKQ